MIDTYRNPVSFLPLLKKVASKYIEYSPKILRILIYVFMKVVGNILLYFGATLFFSLTPLLKVEKK